MSREDELRVATIVGSAVNVDFQNQNYTLDGWGAVDDYVELGPGRILFLEVETSQKHPNTNVLKLWPYLYENPQLTVVLAQVFFPESPGLESSRGKLAVWLGTQMESILYKRFVHTQLIVNRENGEIVGDIDKLLLALQDDA